MKKEYMWGIHLVDVGVFQDDPSPDDISVYWHVYRTAQLAVVALVESLNEEIRDGFEPDGEGDHVDRHLVTEGDIPLRCKSCGPGNSFEGLEYWSGTLECYTGEYDVQIFPMEVHR